MATGGLPRTETVEVRIPPGAQTGSRLRVAGKGNAGTMGAPAGDLYITVRVEPHPFFRRDGDDIEIRVPVTVTEAALGAKIEVPTIDGRALLKIPQGTQNGQKFRLREKGVFNRANGDTRGDQIVEVRGPGAEGPATSGPGDAARAGAAASRRSARGDVEQGVAHGQEHDRKAAYMISAVAEQYQIHPQTLRLYEREGLLKPSRSDGNTRLYTDDDLERLEVILQLTRDLGVNLAGVEIILNMREKMAAMQKQIQEFMAGLNREISSRARAAGVGAENSLIPVVSRTTVVVAGPGKRKR